MSAWASRPLGEDPDKTLASLEQGVTVGLIATYDPMYCDASDDIYEVVNREDLQAFDHIPVRDNGAVAGLFWRTKPGLPESGRVRGAMEPLNGDLLISADAGILSYIQSIDRSPCRLVVSGSTVNAIVTLSDLQKLSVRPAIFLLITHLELLIAEWIRRRCQSGEDWLTRLSEGRQEKVNDKWEDLKTNNLAIDKLTATEFGDKVDLLLKLRPCDGKKKARRELKRVEKLRDSVAHAGDYALTQENAEKTVETVLTAQKWIADLQGDLPRD